MRNTFALASALLLAAPGALAAVSLDLDPETPDPDALATGHWARATITQGLTGAPLAGVVPLAGTSEAAGGFEVRHVDVWIDGRYQGRAEGTTEWTFALDTRRLVDGPHTIAAYALASAREGPAAVRMGWGEERSFASANEASLRRVVLHDQTVTFEGAYPVHWTYTLPDTLVGLRVVIGPGPDADGTPLGVAVFDYVPPQTGEASEARTWHATYGVTSAAASLSGSPHDVFEAGGKLALNAQHFGTGSVRIVVEALDAGSGPHAGGGGEGGAPSFQMRA